MILKTGGKLGQGSGYLKKQGWNPFKNYGYTNYNLYRCWMYIFSWGYSPASLLDILYLARDSLLKHLCSYFLLFLGQLLAPFLYVCMCVCLCVCMCAPSSELAARITSSYSMEKYGKLPYEFLWYWHCKLSSNLVQVNNL